MSTKNQSQNGRIRKKINPFAQVSNFALRDSNMSLKAKGLYALIQSYITIENFILYKNTLRKQCIEGEYSFEQAWKELKEKGYLMQFKLRNESGYYFYEYELLDKPKNEENEQEIKEDYPGGDNPPLDNPPLDNPPCGEPPPFNNTDFSNIDFNNIDFNDLDDLDASDEAKNKIVVDNSEIQLEILNKLESFKDYVVSDIGLHEDNLSPKILIAILQAFYLLLKENYQKYSSLVDIYFASPDLLLSVVYQYKTEEDRKKAMGKKIEYPFRYMKTCLQNQIPSFSNVGQAL